MFDTVAEREMRNKKTPITEVHDSCVERCCLGVLLADCVERSLLRLDTLVFTFFTGFVISTSDYGWFLSLSTLKYYWHVERSRLENRRRK